jgi:flagellar hook-basal body complex protein FliE
MAAPINPIQLADPTASMIQMPGFTPVNQAGGAMFQDMFDTAVQSVQNFQAEATQSVEDLLSGASEDVHKPVIATQKADLAFQLFMQVRNKVVSAYQSVMGTQL